MVSDDFEWDDVKAETNFRKHRVRFEKAVEAFDDVFALIEQDSMRTTARTFQSHRQSQRWLLTVIYTERNGRIRIISAREANGYEQRDYYRAATEE